MMGNDSIAKIFEAILLLWSWLYFHLPNNEERYNLSILVFLSFLFIHLCVRADIQADLEIQYGTLPFKREFESQGGPFLLE